MPLLNVTLASNPQNTDSSDEESLHIDTEVKPEVKGRNSKVKKKGGNAAGILDLLQASKQVGGIDYNTNRYSEAAETARVPPLTRAPVSRP